MGNLMKWTLLILGGLACLTGIVWVLQGLNVLGGSVMSGHSFWAWAGVITLMAGLVMLYMGIRRREAKPAK